MTCAAGATWELTAILSSLIGTLRNSYSRQESRHTQFRALAHRAYISWSKRSLLFHAGFWRWHVGDKFGDPWQIRSLTEPMKTTFCVCCEPKHTPRRESPFVSVSMVDLGMAYIGHTGREVPGDKATWCNFQKTN